MNLGQLEPSRMHAHLAQWVHTTLNPAKHHCLVCSVQLAPTSPCRVLAHLPCAWSASPGLSVLLLDLHHAQHVPRDDMQAQAELLHALDARLGGMAHVPVRRRSSRAVLGVQQS